MVLRPVVFASLCLSPGMLLAEAPSAKPTVLSRDDPERVVCRREAVTGSLAQTRRVCMTRRDWAARSRNAQDETQQMQQQGLVNSCGALEPGRC